MSQLCCVLVVYNFIYNAFPSCPVFTTASTTEKQTLISHNNLNFRYCRGLKHTWLANVNAA